MSEFKMGDKVVVVAAPEKLRYGYNALMDDTIENGGTVQRLRIDGSVQVDGWYYHPAELEKVAKKPVKASQGRTPSVLPVKAKLARSHTEYVVVDLEGNPFSFHATRKEARYTKKALGGLKSGVTILKLEATAEIR